MISGMSFTFGPYKANYLCHTHTFSYAIYPTPIYIISHEKDHDATKPVIGITNKARLKPSSAATETDKKTVSFL